MTMSKKTLNLTKGEHTYVLCYSPGCEDEIVSEIMHLAEDTETDFDWLDAATLSFKVAQNAAVDCYCEMNPFCKDQQGPTRTRHRA